MKTYLYFARHALSSFVPTMEQERSRGLSDQGKSEAAKIAEILVSEGVDVIVSSPYARAIETVQGAADALNQEIRLIEELKERPIASLAYEIPEAEVYAVIEKSFLDIDYCLEEGESTRKAQERAMPVIYALLEEYKGKKTVIGTHGNIMTIIMNALDNQYGYQFWKQTTKPDLYKLEFDGNQLLSTERLWNPINERETQDAHK